jgi:hypothetical protein
MRLAFYEATFLGEKVQCNSFEHARALQTAEAILVGVDTRKHTARQLDQLATVLTHYDCREAANALIERASIMLQGS